jgi:NAD(P)-dependent dehydrogenase (short-subunit alcohol dehydrogenase family)
MGGVDVLVNNAGIATSAPLKAITLEQWNRIFAVNVTGTFLCTQAMVPAMVERGWGRVVNVASVAGKAGAPYIAAYAASKHAVIGFTRSVAAEVAAQGVTVNAVCPGYVETDMSVDTVERIVRKTGLSAEQARANLEKVSPQGRLYTPEEVAYQVTCLCDPRAGGVNGQSLVLDGGWIQT